MSKISLQDIVTQFTTDLLQWHTEQALSTIGKALGGDAPPAPGPRRTGHSKGKKRPPAEIAATVEALLVAIRQNPGERIEQIAKHMGLTTAFLALPAKKLLAAKRVKTKGERRATRYYPIG